jgi:hypothetical protein
LFTSNLGEAERNERRVDTYQRGELARMFLSGE